MHSNFITPPDFVDSILVVDATKEQIEAIATKCRDQALTAYNVYFYNTEMNNLDWLGQVISRVDAILINEESSAPVLNYVKFGANQVLKEPADYFAK